MDKQQKDKNLNSLMESVDALVETSDQLVKAAVMEHRKREQIKNMLLPVLWSQDELYERKIIFTGMRQREVLNAYREVRIRLLERGQSDNMVVLVSSVASAGSSSYFSFNLAATFALDQHKTALYVDCNPYSSDVERYITTPMKEGLTQYLTDYTVPLKNIIYPSGVERLRVIPSGGSSESAAEFFNSKRMEVLIAEIKARYPDRFIVMDAPSVQQSTEARILARYCDHALLVVPFGKAVKDEVLAAVDAVSKEKFAGLVFNN
ncbi:tyrosine-protein kinase family protein [Cellvibrio japonicus]|uniref:Putative polysaccharide biosynthesis protein n=1 Tax=Cellvibrio japonicus (strain Ueda107) TaxID=498211 RepID=B3PFA8_CELJU|nr:polysaccharide biosynthesis protein [Cellvibrio japonicus]ACE84077.1 putative polysaccharide biosynthesis protein [Cellvibrio japonicus Ueda107]QEI13656.1 polysaccharide biosynthesis protein [Cellvibrio japonicus]QEI17229.1 polysaccharide biosynthesis protein [Cellvibrio japonicus]QEI20807.1 polysaccharide biosynthesis protein [Cellvibrio japonicus]